MKTIPLKEFSSRAFSLFDDDWFLLASGDFNKGIFNAMTISWGSFGTMWNKPIAMVAVRPTRYTYEFINRSGDFSLCGFTREHRAAMRLLGTKSGRDSEKIAESGLTPIMAESIQSPVFAEASIVMECRTIYSQDMDPGRFIDPDIIKHYTENDFHRFFIGEVLLVRGTKQFLQDTF